MDVFTCARLHTHLDEAGTALAVNAERHLKSPGQIRRLFADLPEALDNTVRLADRLEFAFPDIGYEFPNHVPENGMSAEDCLREVTCDGARQRYGAPLKAEVRAQLEQELSLIIRLGFTGYFLLVWDIVNSCKQNGILVQGRGSAANSTVCYCLGITAIDPIKEKLLFERFLNENRAGGKDGRKAWPDIDLDLPSGDPARAGHPGSLPPLRTPGRRHDRKRDRFPGPEHDARDRQGANLPTGVLDLFSSQFHPGDFPETLELQDHFRQAGLDGAQPRAQACVELYQAIHGLPRHLGQHSGGMVIRSDWLDSVVSFLKMTGPVQTRRGLPLVRAVRIERLDCPLLEGVVSHDFH